MAALGHRHDKTSVSSARNPKHLKRPLVRDDDIHTLIDKQNKDRDSARYLLNLGPLLVQLDTLEDRIHFALTQKILAISASYSNYTATVAT